MTGPVYGTLSDIASKFVILPEILADALDVYGSNADAWAWFDGDKLTKLELDG